MRFACFYLPLLLCGSAAARLGTGCEAHASGQLGGKGGEEEAVMRLGRIGLDNVAGYLGGGMNALVSRDDLVERTERVTAAALAEWLAGARAEMGAKPVVIDVRSEVEHAAGHVVGARSDRLALPDETECLAAPDFEGDDGA